MIVTVDDIEGIFPRPLDQGERDRAELLLLDADDLIREAFLRQGRDLDRELDDKKWLPYTYKRVVKAMISHAILVGPHVGVQNASSTTGPQSDSITYSQGVGIHWGGVYLSDDWLRDLGLLNDGLSMGSFPRPLRFQDSRVSRGRRGVEFAERGRHVVRGSW